jgi:predicted unusual protein kinase regulating ubiquinone biosynthesis (AarF/ABC1/UbiB family)
LRLRLEALEEIAQFIDTHTELGKRYEFGNILIGLRKSLLQELDFQAEASNLLMFAENLREFDRIIIPEPILDFTTSRVLTMDYVPGKKITELSSLKLLEIDGPGLADELFRAYLKQILVDGVFHADPHPGTVFLTDDARIALLDVGMVARLMTGFLDNLLRLLLAISEGRGEEAAEIAIRMGESKAEFDKAEFSRRVADLVAENANASLSRIDAGHVALEIMKISADCWLRLPSEFTMIAKEVVEIKEFVEKLPTRVNRILDAVGNNDLRIRVDAIDEKLLLEGLQKVANRITLRLVLAALIVGAAMLMRVETSSRILGYPGFSMIFFLIAAIAGCSRCQHSTLRCQSSEQD